MAVIWYDPNAATNGTGASASSPRNTWALPGDFDKVLIKQGSTWVRTTQLNLAAVQGLTFDAYSPDGGPYDPSLPMPLIVHTSPSVNTWNFQGAGVHTIKHLDFTDCTAAGGTGAGGVIGAGLVASTSVYASIVVDECEFNNVTGLAAAIRCQGTGSQTSPLLRVLRSKFDTIAEDAVYGGSLVYEFAYNDCARLSAYSSTGDGVGFIGVDPVFAWVHHNRIDHRDKNFKHCVIIDSTTPGAGFALVEDNDLIGYGGDGDPATGHTMVNGDCRMLVRRNKLQTSGIAINLAGANSVARDNVIFINEVNPNAENVISLTANGGLVEFNTLIARKQLSIGNGVAIDSGITGTTVRNNAFKGIPTAVKTNSPVSNPTVRNNAFQDVINRYLEGVSGTWAGVNDVIGDLLLDYNGQPKAGSPLLQAGFHTGYASDLAGVQRWNPPTIGAYERPQTLRTASALRLRRS